MYNHSEGPKITVFTPAYNRGYIIEKLYRSLQRQHYSDFEWLVVDDGSTDNTEFLFQQYLVEDNHFLIRYIKTENGGKHRAINRGVREANGKLFFIVDSDDYITDDALEMIDKIEETISDAQKEKFAGVCGLKCYEMGNTIGSTFSGDYLDITNLERDKYGITGDKAEAYYTDIMKRYPFPEFDGEKFVTECVVWDRIAADGYKLRYYNHPAIICEYLPDGLTANLNRQIQNSPRGHAVYLRQCQKYGRLSGTDACDSYIGFYENIRDKYSFAEIGKMLNMKPIELALTLFLMRVYRRLFASC